MNDDGTAHDATLEDAARRLGAGAADRLDVERTVQAVLTRLREEPRVPLRAAWAWSRPAWLKIAAALVIVAGAAAARAAAHGRATGYAGTRVVAGRGTRGLEPGAAADPARVPGNGNVMKHVACVLMLVLTPALTAQVPGDSGAAPPADGEAQRLRAQVRQRWAEHVRTTLELSDAQAGKLDATERRFEEQRQPIRARQRQINQALHTELAAQTPNEDRVKQLMSEREQNQLKLQHVNRDEDREMQGYLTPVQRARYQEERRRFQGRIVDALRQQRERRQNMPAPRARPRRRPPR